MPVDYRFAKGVDLPVWQWLSPFLAGVDYHGSSNAYDGTRYMYWVIQYGVTSTSASTTQLWRFDTWTNGWQFLAATTSGNRGIDVEYDPVRNIILFIHGAALTSWQVFNLNTTAVTFCGVTCNPWVLTTMTPVLPAAADYGATILLPDDTSIPAPITTGVVGTGSTTTVLVVADDDKFFPTHAGIQVRFTSGALNGQKRLVTTVTNARQVTLDRALASAPVAGESFVIELPEDTASAGTTTTLTGPSGVAWITNVYANHDVIITGGTGSGQRRRIASNTATVLTLAGATTGNPRTGAFTTTPDATSTFKIVPSSDFLYYQPGSTATTFWRIDVVATPAAAWTSLTAVPASINSGANMMHLAAGDPFTLMTVRANATATVYSYDIGTNAWQTRTSLWGSETITTGASTARVAGKGRIFIAKESSQRCYLYNIYTGQLESAGWMPYAAPAAYDGKRARHVKTPDGVDWIYLMRAGGQEFFRFPLEWLP